jgi:hypothetical protein
VHGICEASPQCCNSLSHGSDGENGNEKDGNSTYYRNRLRAVRTATGRIGRGRHQKEAHAKGLKGDERKKYMSSCLSSGKQAKASTGVAQPAS